MRHIQISNEIAEFRSLQDKHLNPPSNSTEATTKWKGLNRTTRKNISKRLLKQQYYLCCYSEISIDGNLGYHIEHIENKEQNPARTFDYQNLAVSALSSKKLEDFKSQHDGKNLFSGQAQGKQAGVDMNRFIPPYQTDCSRYFDYSSLDGKIKPALNLSPADQDKAQYTIDILNLNCPYLQIRREQQFKELADTFEISLQPDNFDIHDWAKKELLPEEEDGIPKLKAFFSLKRQFFQHFAEKVISEYNNGELI